MTDDLTLNMDAYLPLRDVVFNTLREAILKGDLKPGERLMELQLAAKLGVSRTPVSYTHLDVYKRQPQNLCGSNAGKNRQWTADGGSQKSTDAAG